MTTIGKLYQIPEKLWKCYPCPMSNSLAPESESTKEFEKWALTLTNELIDNLKKVISTPCSESTETYATFSFLGKEMSIGSASDSFKKELSLFSHLKSNLDQVVSDLRLNQLLELHQIPERILMIQKKHQGTPVLILADIAVLISDLLSNYQLNFFRRSYSDTLYLTKNRYPIDNEILILLLDRLIFAFQSPIMQLITSALETIKPILSFFRPVSKTQSVLIVTWNSALPAVYGSYFDQEHPDRLLALFQQLTNSAETYLIAYDALTQTQQPKYVEYCKKYTYISDLELSTLLNYSSQKKIKEE